MTKKTISFCTGGRADYGLLEPLIEACQADFEVKLFVTGSHLSSPLGRTERDIKFPITARIDCLMDSDSFTAVSLAQAVSLSQFATIFKYTDVGMVVVLGDRFELVPVALAAYNNEIPIVHIEGDDTTLGSLDEGYRGCIRSLARYHFTTADYGSLGCVFPEVRPGTAQYEVVMVYHPAIGWNEREYGNIIEACKDYECLIIGGSADPGGRWVLSTPKTHCFRISMPRAEYISYLRGAKFIIGNSSSGIIEAPSLGVPSIDVGDRQKGRKRAESVLHCTDYGSLVNTIEYLETKPVLDFTNPYYKPNTVEAMVEDLKLICN